MSASVNDCFTGVDMSRVSHPEMHLGCTVKPINPQILPSQVTAANTHSTEDRVTPEVCGYFWEKKYLLPLSWIKPQFTGHPAPAQSLYRLHYTGSVLCPAALSTISSNAHTHDSWSLHTFQPDRCNQTDHFLCTCVARMLWVLPQRCTSHQSSSESGQISLAQYSNVSTVLKGGLVTSPHINTRAAEASSTSLPVALFILCHKTPHPLLLNPFLFFLLFTLRISMMI